MSPEAEVARLARAQEGMITWAQLRGAGVSRHAIAKHEKDGWLVLRHRGVYQLGVFGGPYGEEMAALLACGRHAVLSHRTAAWVFELCRRAGRVVEVLQAEGLAGRRRAPAARDRALPR